MTVFDSRFRGMLAEGRPLLGLFNGWTLPAIVEMGGYTGFDFTVIDTEHGPGSFESVENMVRASRSSGIVPIVRVSSPNTTDIQKALDCGASGVQVPQVNSVEQAEMIVWAAKYPPEGGRGAAFSPRAAGYGLFGGAGHLTASNAGTAVVAHIETVQAVESLDAMLKVTGIDVWFIGPTDLSVSMGYPGQPGHPEVQAAIEGCVRKIAGAGMASGIMATSAEDFQKWAGKGVRYITVHVAPMLGNALRAMARVKES